MILKQGISKKVSRLFLMILIFIFLLSTQDDISYAYEAHGHNEIMCNILFGKGYAKNQSVDINRSITKLEKASQLTIDQFGGYQKASYEYLKKYVTFGIPRKFDDINYVYDFDKGNEINANSHRKYTHNGWDVSINNKDADKFWKKRKKVLLSTVNNVFDFGILSTSIHYDKKCNAMCGIIYYIHILGDCKEKKVKPSTVISLVVTDEMEQNTIMYQLKAHIEVLFVEQADTMDYKQLLREMNKIEREARKIERGAGNVYSEEDNKAYSKCVNDLLETLEKYIPKLLKKEKFFAEVFYPNEM